MGLDPEKPCPTIQKALDGIARKEGAEVLKAHREEYQKMVDEFGDGAGAPVTMVNSASIRDRYRGLSWQMPHDIIWPLVKLRPARYLLAAALLRTVPCPV